MIPLVTSGRGVTLMLGMLCLALCVVVYRELDGAAGAAEAVPARLSPAAAAPLPAEPVMASLPPIEAYAEVVQRPVFLATRRPPAPEAAQETLGAAEGFALLGVAIADDGKIALIQHGRPAALARLQEGQAVEGWTVQSIEPDRIVIEHGATQRELKLKDRPLAPSSPAHAPLPVSRRD